MKKEKRTTGSIVEIVERFSTDEACRKHLVLHRWSNKPKCVHCDSEHVYTYSDGIRYKCKACSAIFTVTVGTLFESSKISLRKWFIAIYLETGHKKGISSHQLARDIRVQQKTAWFMLHRIRNAMRSKACEMKLEGFVECDEMYIGGKEKNKHASKRTHKTMGRSSKTKEIVVGAIQRGGRVRIRHIKDAKATTIHAFIHEHVRHGSCLFTDEWKAYSRLVPKFQHIRINHSEGKYVDGLAHTNTIENFWSQLSRGIIGVYHHVSPKHLQRYCDGFMFRFNTRTNNQRLRFNLLLMQCESRIKYKELIVDVA